MEQEGRSYPSIYRGILNIPCAVVEPFGKVAAIPLEHTAMGDPSCVRIADRRCHRARPEILVYLLPFQYFQV